MKFTEKQPNIYIFQRFLAKTRDSLGLVNVPIWMAQTKETNLNQQKPRRGVGGTAIYGLYPGGYCHIWAIQVCAAVKGMVFKQFTLGQGDQSVWVQNRVSFLRKLISWLKIYLDQGNSYSRIKGIWGVYSSIGQQNLAELALVKNTQKFLKYPAGKFCLGKQRGQAVSTQLGASRFQLLKSGGSEFNFSETILCF